MSIYGGCRFINLGGNRIGNQAGNSIYIVSRAFFKSVFLFEMSFENLIDVAIWRYVNVLLNKPEVLKKGDYRRTFVMLFVNLCLKRFQIF